MILAATKVTIQGKRLWIEVNDDAEADAITQYIDYHGQTGTGYHMQFKEQLPDRERIELDGTT